MIMASRIFVRCMSTSRVASKQLQRTQSVQEMRKIEENDISLKKYPPWKMNTLLNVAHRSTEHIIERFGRYDRTITDGLYVAIPLVEKIAAVVDTREMVIEINPQRAITQDNINIDISGVVCIQVLDTKKFTYSIQHPKFAIVKLAEAAMRTQCGKLTLDDLLHKRNLINEGVREALAHIEEKWGAIVLRYEVTDIHPDEKVTDAMDLQAVAERERRQEVIKAEADKTSKMLRAEGHAYEVERKAKAEAEATIVSAKASAEATIVASQARAKAIREVAMAMSEPMGVESVRIDLAKDYIGNIPALGENGRLIMIPEDASNVNGMIAKATAIASDLLKK